ncbi:MAG: DUF4235 domain-containing protein [Actinomycetota bacterium]
MGKAERTSGLIQKLLALGLSALAAKLALMAIEKLWTKGLHKPIPSGDESSMATKLAWMGVTAAAVGMAREMVRELTAPTVREESVS